MKQRRRQILICLSMVIPLSACSVGPPGCSDSVTLEVLDEFLMEEAVVGAILVPATARLYGEPVLLSSPSAMAKIHQRDFEGALVALEASISSIKDEKDQKRHRAVLTAAQTSTYEVSALTTVQADDRRTYCSFSVEFTYGQPSLEEVGYSSDLQSTLDMLKTMRQARTFETYYADDGTQYVELDPPP